MNVSDFKDENSLFQRGMSDKSPVSVTMEKLYQLITGDLLHDSTEKVRYFYSAGLSRDGDKEKKRAMCFTPSVKCKDGHSRKNVLTYTGKIMVDGDDITVVPLSNLMEQLHHDPYVLLAYITISGEGIRIICQTDVTNIDYHPYAYAQVNEYFARLLNLEVDPKCKDATRCSIICQDVNAYFNPNAKVMHIEIPAEEATPLRKPGRPRKKHSATIEESEKIVLDELKRQGKKYKEGHYNEYVSSALYLMNSFGITEEEALQWAVERFDDYNSQEVTSICHSVYQHTDEHGSRSLPHAKSSSQEGPESYYASIDDLEAFISTQAEIRLNLFNRRREIRMKEEDEYRSLTDIDENSLWLRAKKEGLHTSFRIFTCILNSEYIGSYHPFHDFADGLPEWDGVTDYISQVASIVNTSDDYYFHVCFKKWLVTVVASLLDPKIVNHEILTFIGKEGSYKTTFFNSLLPPVLQKYFSPKISSGFISKDDLLSITELMLICLEEIDNMTMEKMDQIKASVTLPKVSIRAPYAHNRELLPHNSSFCATGNNHYFLPDGDNRRWLVMHVLNIDSERLKQIPYENLYAQAVSLYRSGFQYWFDDQESKNVSDHNEQFKEPNLEDELLLDHYRCPRSGETPRLLSLATIMLTLGAGLKYPLSRIKIRQALDKQGFLRKRTNTLRGFLVIPLTPEEKKEREHYKVPKEELEGPSLSFKDDSSLE